MKKSFGPLKKLNFALYCIMFLSLFLTINLKTEARTYTIPSGGYFNYPGPNNTGMHPGDTLLFDANNNYTYFSLKGINGTPGHPIVFKNVNGQVSMANGFNLEDCSYYHIDGTGSFDFYGFYMHDNGGTPVSITGKSSNFEVNNIYVNNCTYVLWFKTEVAQYPCDASYWYPMNMDNLYVHDLLATNIGQDGFYVGSTDPLAKRDERCNGGPIFHQRPASVSNIRIERIRGFNINRTFCQVSGANSGTNYIINSSAYNCGTGLNSDQGAGFIYGSYSIGTMDHDTSRLNYIYNFAVYGGAGHIVFTNNVIDSAGYCLGHKNPQPLPSTIFIASQAVTSYDIENTTGPGINTASTPPGYPNGTGTQTALYNNNGAAATSGNIVCNAQAIANPQNIIYSPKCAVSSFTITSSVTGINGTISPSGATSVAPGGSQAYTILANSGYHILDVSVDGGSVGAVSSYNFSSVAADHTINATFQVDPSNTPPTVNAGNDTTVEENTNITLNGSGSDVEGPVTFMWSVLLSPGVVTFNDMTSPTPVTSFSIVGTYTLRLTATDNSGVSSFDDMQVIVTPNTNGLFLTEFIIKKKDGSNLKDVKLKSKQGISLTGIWSDGSQQTITKP